MFRIHHPLFIPICSADDHSGERGLCSEKSPTFGATGRPFYCTLDKEGHTLHQAAVRRNGFGALHIHTQRPLTRDTLILVAEWDDHRETDGLA